MAIANELTINSATALQMAETIFGTGITVTGATYTGDAASAGIYSGAGTTIPGISPTGSGVILSTGRVADFTNSTGSTNTNEVANRSTNTAGVDGDSQLNAVAGQGTFDASILQATFVPDGDTITMQFVFSSEEYPEYVNQNVNDAFGVWVNGSFVPVSITVAGSVAIDEVNAARNENFYRSNSADQFNTEMDGLTYVLSIKAPVNPGVANTIKIAIGDGGDAIFDSNLLIAADSVQTVTLAMDDTINTTANTTRTFDILANDVSTTGAPLTITQIMGQNIVAGQTITLTSGQQVRLNADGTITVTSNGTLGQEAFSYTVSNGTTTDVGYIKLNTGAAPALDGIVSGTSGDDLIDASYLGDPDGDRIDNNDATGVQGTSGNADLIYAGAGNDTVLAGAGHDIIFAGSGNDSVFGGAGDDRVTLGSGNDSFGSAADAGDGNDSVTGGAGNDTLWGGAGNDTLSGGDDADLINAGAGDTVDGGSGGTDNDTLAASGVVSVVFAGNDPESGVLTFADGRTLTFAEIEHLHLNGTRDGYVHGTGGDDLMGPGYVDATGDIIDANDAILPGHAPNDDWIFAGAGNDTVLGGVGDDRVEAGSGNDSVAGGSGDDSVMGDAGRDSLEGEAGNDTLYGGEDEDFVYGGDGEDALYGGAGADALDGGDNHDLIHGDGGDDWIFGDLGQDTAYGGFANDSLYGGSGEDALYGGEDDDLIEGGADADILGGGEGNDTLRGGAGSDSIDGGAGNDLIDGSDPGGLGQDTLAGGAGNDTIIAGGGAPGQVEGGDDRDTVIVTSAASMQLDGGAGGDDFDTLDLSAFGKDRTEVIYTSPDREDGYVRLFDAAGVEIGRIDFTDIEKVIPCFTPGTRILTEEGLVRVEDLRPGARVLTRDDGFQPLRWIGRRDLGAAELAARPAFAPVVVRAGALGPGMPVRDMMVSPQHRLLMTGQRAELLFGEAEVLVAALHLVGRPGITRARVPGVSYLHLLFDTHQILQSDGVWTESFQPGAAVLGGLADAARDEVLALFPQLAGGELYPAARLTLKPHEVRVLMAA